MKYLGLTIKISLLIINTKKKAKKLSSLIPLGWREWVLVPLYNLRLKAKIDTGARISSIHASNIQVYQKRKHNINIPHIVEEKNGKFIVELLEDIDVEKLDNLLENP